MHITDRQIADDREHYSALYWRVVNSSSPPSLGHWF